MNQVLDADIPDIVSDPFAYFQATGYYYPMFPDYRAKVDEITETKYVTIEQIQGVLELFQQTLDMLTNLDQLQVSLYNSSGDWWNDITKYSVTYSSIVKIINTIYSNQQ